MASAHGIRWVPIRSARSLWTVTIRVLIADDDPVLRGGVRAAFDESTDVLVVGEASDGEGVLEVASDLEAGVVFMDADMPGIGGLEATRILRDASADIKVILFFTTVQEARSAMSEARQVGAAGLLLKETSLEDLVSTTRLVHEGKMVVHPALTKAWIEEIQKPQSSTLLSAEESEVMQLLAEGATSKEIAEQLNISTFMVKVHVKRIFEKLGLRGDHFS